MDELLSLFGADDDSAGQIDSGTAPGDDGCECPETGDGASGTNNNDFGSVFGSAFAGEAANNMSSVGKRNGGQHASQATLSGRSQMNQPRAKLTSYPTMTKKSTAATKNGDTTTSCDPITGIRILDRRTSRAAMVDAFSTFTYKSCSRLAAASRAEWSGNYLVDGGGGNGNGPSGKTNLVTCGILTKESSSRLSSKTGRAFATMSLGDLPSSMHARGSTHSNSANNLNASITVMLFGDALSSLKSNKKYFSAGYAVAIMGPNLLPPSNYGSKAGDTSVTLSVNDPQQILPM